MADAIAFTWSIGEQRLVQQTLLTTERGLSDFRPVWDKFVPNVRRRHSVTFRQQASPFTGAPWPRLSKEYAASKGRSGKITKKRGGGVAQQFRPLLVLSGKLKTAATGKGAFGQIVVMQMRYMEFGVDLGEVYPAVHQKTERIRKDGTPIKRVWLGLKVPDDLIALQAQIVRRITLDQKAAGGGRLKIIRETIGRGSA